MTRREFVDRIRERIASALCEDAEAWTALDEPMTMADVGTASMELGQFCREHRDEFAMPPYEPDTGMPSPVSCPYCGAAVHLPPYPQHHSDCPAIQKPVAPQT